MITRASESVQRRLRRVAGGFTIIELLVVIAIIGLLVALLFPAVQGAREAGRRVQCSNNLRQIGIGLLTHLELQGKFPDNGEHWHSAWARRPGMMLVKLLPYMEQQAIFDRICKGKILEQIDVYDEMAADSALASTVIGGLRCPTSGYPSLNANGQAVTNYVCSAGSQKTNTPRCGQYPGNLFGTGPATDANIYPGENPNRISGLFSRIYSWSAGSQDVPDGMSNTIAVGEVRPECSGHLMAAWWDSKKCFVTTSIPLNFPTCPTEPPGNANASGCNSMNSWNTEVGFKSSHPQAVGFVFADGAVRFLRETIDFRNYQRLGCRRDGTAAGEVLQAF